MFRLFLFRKMVNKQGSTQDIFDLKVKLNDQIAASTTLV